MPFSTSSLLRGIRRLRVEFAPGSCIGVSGSEIELKLRVEPESFGRLSKAAALRGAASTRRTLETVYFDTADFALRRAGAVLRVRRDGTRYVQTVKSRGRGAALQRREEIETPLAGALPDLARLPREFPVTAAEKLEPVFTTRIDRVVRKVEGIEVAFDTGEIRTPHGVIERISEVEFELKSGSPRDVFVLALALADSAPVALETRTKSERGYLLAGAEGAGATSAEPLALEKGASTGEAVAAILRHCLDHLTANQALAYETGDAAGVHQMRVALRRFRSVLGLLSSVLPREESGRLAADAKWLAGILGAARDLDVLLDQTIAPARSALPDDGGIGSLATAVAASREKAFRAMRRAIASARYTRFVLRFGAFVEDSAWQSGEDAAAFAARLLDKRAAKAKRLGKKFRKLDPERRHELRIALKKLRYAAELFASLFQTARPRKYVKRLAALQNGLGRASDLETARRILGDLVAASPEAERVERAAAAGRVIGWHAHALALAEDEMEDEWRAFVAARPFWV